MRFSSSASCLVLATLLGCSAPDDPASTEPASVESDLSGAGSECVVDTIFVKQGFLADLAASVDPTFIKDYGPQYYKHVEIPKALDAALPTTAEFGEAINAIHAFDYVPEELAAGATAAPRRFATIAGSPVVDPKLSFAKSRYFASKAIFDAMTRATEATQNHIVPPSHVYDRSWTKVTRTSPNGRIACVKTTYPGATSAEYACTFTDIERNMIQAYDTNGTGGHCPTR